MFNLILHFFSGYFTHGQISNKNSYSNLVFDKTSKRSVQILKIKLQYKSEQTLQIKNKKVVFVKNNTKIS